MIGRRTCAQLEQKMDQRMDDVTLTISNMQNLMMKFIPNLDPDQLAACVPSSLKVSKSIIKIYYGIMHMIGYRYIMFWINYFMVNDRELLECDDIMLLVIFIF